MTFKEFLEIVEDLREKGENTYVEVGIWVDDDGRRDLKWIIWSSKYGEHFSGETAESALAKYRIKSTKVDPGVDPVPTLEAKTVTVPASDESVEEVPF